MTAQTETVIMESTDVDVDNDYANESVGVTQETGLWVLDGFGALTNFSEEVQREILFSLAQRFGLLVVE